MPLPSRPWWSLGRGALCRGRIPPHPNLLPTLGFSWATFFSDPHPGDELKCYSCPVMSPCPGLSPQGWGTQPVRPLRHPSLSLLHTHGHTLLMPHLPRHACSLTRILSHPVSQTHTHTDTLTRTLSRTLTQSHAHIFSHTLSHTFSHSHSHTHPGGPQPPPPVLCSLESLAPVHPPPSHALTRAHPLTHARVRAHTLLDRHPLRSMFLGADGHPRITHHTLLYAPPTCILLCA